MDNNEALTDNELVLRYRNGDVECFNQLLERYQAKVYGYIFSVVKDKDKADEIFQETFYKVIKDIYTDQYNKDLRFGQWLLHIAYNLIKEKKEKNK
ncbi:MAG: hypothetical protein K5918_07655 [Bacteroidales bacterium]|nr:hypothetical protein [Bacteroidales bacterium]